MYRYVEVHTVHLGPQHVGGLHGKHATDFQHKINSLNTFKNSGISNGDPFSNGVHYLFVRCSHEAVTVTFGFGPVQSDTHRVTQMYICPDMSFVPNVLSIEQEVGQTSVTPCFFLCLMFKRIKDQPPQWFVSICSQYLFPTLTQGQR